MAIAFGGVRKGPFGGPAGQMNDAISSIFEGIKRYREEEKNKSENQSILDAITQNTSSQGHPSGGMYQPSIQEQIGSILSDNRIPMEQKGRVANMLLEQAKAKNLTQPPPPPQKEPKATVVEWWDPKGNGHKTRVPDSQYNRFVMQVEKAGGTVQKQPEGKESTSEYLTLMDRYVKVDPDSKTGKLLKSRMDKLVEKSGGTSASNQLNEMKVSAWRAYYNKKATPEQKRLIGVDTDPYIARAAQMVMSDIRAQTKSAKEKAEMTMDLATVIRKAANEKEDKTGDDFEVFLDKYDR